MNEIKYDIKNDGIFKNIFGKFGNEKFIKKFLELVLKININRIDVGHDITIEKIKEGEKGAILDIRAIVNDNIIVNIEMQKEKRGNILDRTEKYGANIFVRNMKKGEKYVDAKEVIIITILNYKLFEDENYITDLMSVLRQNKAIEVKTKIRRFFIELPKIEKIQIDIENELMQWLVYFYGKDRRLVKMAIEKNEMIKQINDQVYYLQGKEADERLAEMQENWDYMIASVKEDSKEEGKIEGEKNKALSIAKKLLKLKMKKEYILEVTGLQEKELKNLV